MAQNNYKIQPDRPKKNDSSRPSILDKRTKITIGLFLQGMGIFLGFAFFSHLTHGNKDQAIIESFSTLGFKASSLAISNALGFAGAFVGYYCLHIWWGITAFIFLPCLFIIGMKMVVQKIWANLSWLKLTIASIFLVLWSNVLLGYLYTIDPSNTMLMNYLGGVAYTLGELFRGLLGYGTFILLLITGLIFIVICFNITALPTTNLFTRKKNALLNSCLEKTEDNKDERFLGREDEEITGKKKTTDPILGIKNQITYPNETNNEHPINTALENRNNIDFEIITPASEPTSRLKTPPSIKPSTTSLNQDRKKGEH